MAATLVTVVGVLITAPPALGAGYQEPFYGDLNGDGIPDRVTLAVAPPDQCVVIVDPGRPPGAPPIPPEVHLFPIPGTGPADPDRCPDLGEVVDYGTGMEIVTGFFHGRRTAIPILANDVYRLTEEDRSDNAAVTIRFAP